MAQKTVTVCDGCGAVIKEPSKRFHIKMLSEFFTDAAGQQGQTNLKELDFCSRCASNVAVALEIIARRLEKKE